MDQGLRYSSSRETTVGSSEDRAKFEGAAEQGLDEGLLGAPSSRFSRLAASFRAQSPRLYNVAARVVTYVRGPRPEVDLPSKSLSSG